MGLAIGVDIGGTKVAAGVVDTDGHILARLRQYITTIEDIFRLYFIKDVNA